ncbi:MAG: hypothetical protein BLITH_0672 [Brockia lithotrophica]|uniref:Uncharacterized protein n=1 Tax=Brockia lithotrophica TaxID=933949 RepID=A0A2T5G8J2_9BACL|nr:MAG: hypothetical protein BLITH_0672 [Brockia lithotrophica]
MPQPPASGEERRKKRREGDRRHEHDASREDAYDLRRDRVEV